MPALQSSDIAPPSSNSPSTWSSEANDLLYPILFPLRDPLGTYYTIYNSINMGIFSGKQFTANDIPNLSGKVYLVTGGESFLKHVQIEIADRKLGNIGLGKETVLQLAKHNAEHIYLGARTQRKAENAIADIKKTVPNAKITWLPLDLANLESISNAAKKFSEQSSRLDVLINNAGVMALPNGKTSDGFEIQFGTNHIGSFAFTKLLLPTLQSTAKSTGDARIVNLSSEAHNFRRNQGIELDTEKMQKLGVWEAYGNSKFANVLFAREHAKRYPDIISVSVHPGVIVGTGLYDSTKTKSFLNKIGVYAMSFVLPDVPTGALNQLWATTVDKSEIKNGAYHVPIGKFSSGSSKVADTSRDAELWNWTEKELQSKGFKG